MKLLCSLLIVAILKAQQPTQVDLSRQTKTADFSGQPVTKPVTVGSVTPSTCSVGQMFFLTTATPGTNLLSCTATNVWSALAGSSAAAVALSTTSLVFGTLNPAVSSAPSVISMTDTGTSYLTISSIGITGTNASDFTQTNTCGSTLGSGNSCTITVTFTPSMAASGGAITWSETATLNIAGSQPTSPSTVALSGTGQLVNGGLVVTTSQPGATEGQTITFTANRAVTFAASTGNVGTLTSVDSTHATYTAPASIPVQTPIAGCPAGPNNSVLNTPINNLPVNSNSTAWLSSIHGIPITAQPSFFVNAVTGTPATWTEKFYYFPTGGGTYPLLSWPNKKREKGHSSSKDNGQDHHQLAVLVAPGASQCTTYETYNDAVNSATTYPCSDSSSGCNSVSGDTYGPSTTTLTARTDAANLPQYLTLQADEVLNNTINHPIRFTLAAGYIQLNSLPTLWPAGVGTNNGGASNTNGLPYGARLRLKASYSTSGKSTNAINILNALKNQGIINSDVGSSGALIVGSSLSLYPAVLAALSEALTGLTFNNFEVVDESSLMVSRNSLLVNPANTYVTPVSSAGVVVTDAAPVSGTTYSASFSLPLQGVGIGFLHNPVSMLPGSYTYNFGASGKAWATGTSNQTLNWSLVSGSGSITSGGTYTPPTSVSSVTQVVLKATSAADTAISANLYLTLYPVPGDGKFRIMEGGTSSGITDGGSNFWQFQAGLETGILNHFAADYPSWTSLSGNNEQNVYQAYGYNYSDDLLHFFIVPNGNYKIRYLMGFAYNGGCNSGTGCGTYGGAGAMEIGAQSQVAAHNWVEGASVGFAYATPFDFYAPAQVTTNELNYSIGPYNPDGGTNGASVSISATEIIPDASSAHITIDTGMEAYNPSGTAITQPLVVPHGTTAQLYAVGWYMANTVTWSCTGGGSINSSTGVYTAPASGTATVTVTATSTVTGSISATATLNVT